MRGHTGARLQVGRQDLPALPLHPQGSNGSARFVLERAREVNDGAARVARPLPVLAGRFGVGGEEGEIHVLELFGPHALNEADLVAHRLELAQGLIVIEQAHVHRREIAVVQHFGNFLTTQRSGAYDCGPVQGAADGGQVGSRGNGFGGGAHEVRVASL